MLGIYGSNSEKKIIADIGFRMYESNLSMITVDVGFRMYEVDSQRKHIRLLL